MPCRFCAMTRSAIDKLRGIAAARRQAVIDQHIKPELKPGGNVDGEAKHDDHHGQASPTEQTGKPAKPKRGRAKADRAHGGNGVDSAPAAASDHGDGD